MCRQRETTISFCRSLFLFACIHVRACVYIWMYVYVFICDYICECENMCNYICECTSIYGHMCTYLCAIIYVSVKICVFCICECAYKHTQVCMKCDASSICQYVYPHHTLGLFCKRALQKRPMSICLSTSYIYIHIYEQYTLILCIYIHIIQPHHSFSLFLI